MDTESDPKPVFKHLTGVVFTGGLSKRMGSPKALLTYRNVPLFKHAENTLTPFTRSVYFSHRTNSFELPTDEKKILFDIYEEAGPLGGILTVLEHTQSPLLTLPCDTPLIDGKIIELLIKLRNHQKICTTFYDPDSGNYEPLIAIWEVSAIRVLKESLSAKQFSLQKILETNHVVKHPLPDKNKFRNVNTPEDRRLVLD